MVMVSSHAASSSLLDSLKPNEPLALDKGAEVEVFVTTPLPDDPRDALIGHGESDRTEDADNHDHYMYGTADVCDFHDR